jgi:hypothetical protein
LQLSRPFIRLPYGFDAQRLAGEVRALPDSLWMAHPSGFPGNSAVSLVSREGKDNDDMQGRMCTTPHLDGAPCLQQVMASFGEVLGRSRLMKLAPGAEVSLHVDFNYHWHTRVRIHIPVITNPGVTFFCGDESLHMKAGECWIFDSWNRHRVVNGGAGERVHLVLDIAGSSRFWQTVRKMEQLDPARDTGAIERTVRYVPFEAGARVEILTENFNIAPVMAPGELDALVREVVADFAANPKNDAGLAAAYSELLTDFARDWRELWLQYGYRREGWPEYEAAITRVRRRLHPKRRALVTKSNDIGVNPIVVQRILNAALATDQYERFAS